MVEGAQRLIEQAIRFREKFNSEWYLALMLSMYAGSRLIGKIVLRERTGMSDPFKNVDSCIDQIMTLKDMGHESERVFIVENVEIVEDEKGKGYGKMLYSEAFKRMREKVGEPIFVMPSWCTGYIGTSKAAGRVWDSLSGEYPSSKRVLYIEQHEGGPSTEDFILWQAANWHKYGPVGKSIEGLDVLSNEFYGVDFMELSDEPHQVLYNFVSNIDFYSNQMLPPVKADHVRINHTLGLRDVENIGSIIRDIIANGVVAQAQGSGQYSESPGSIFGVADNPSAGPKNVYNPNYPWVSLDVPIELDPWSLKDISPGGVAVLPGFIDAKYIAGFNGVPLAAFRQALEKYGS